MRAKEKFWCVMEEHPSGRSTDYNGRGQNILFAVSDKIPVPRVTNWNFPEIP